LVVERIRGRLAHCYLVWSVGMLVSQLGANELLEIPVTVWKKHAGKDHKKSDEADAIAIGECAIALAKEGVS